MSIFWKKGSPGAWSSRFAWVRRRVRPLDSIFCYTGCLFSVSIFSLFFKTRNATVQIHVFWRWVNISTTVILRDHTHMLVAWYSQLLPLLFSVFISSKAIFPFANIRNNHNHPKRITVCKTNLSLSPIFLREQQVFIYIATLCIWLEVQTEIDFNLFCSITL
jgi:hypothetical protein